jgi:hypothetical protein
VHNIFKRYNKTISLDVSDFVVGRRWAGCVAYMGEKRNGNRSWRGNLNKRDHLADLGVDGRVLKWIWKK